LAGVTALAYVRRDWVRNVEKRNAPPAAPVDVTRQSAGINFKQGDKNRTIYEVSASKSTEFKGQDASLLEDVRITIFGKTGDRHDVIHTRSCRYGKENGGIACDGDVQIDLMSAVDAERTAGRPEAAGSVTTRIETRGITFTRASGLAQTDQKVRFSFPSGSGEAVGLEYKSEEGAVHLVRDVWFTLKQIAPMAGKALRRDRQNRPPQEAQVKGTSLDFGRDSRLLHLFGPAEAVTTSGRLSAGEIKLLLDKEFHAEMLVASGTGENKPSMVSLQIRDPLRLDADTLTAHFSPEGAVTSLDAAGAVRGTRKGAAEQDQASAQSGSLTLWPVLGQPKELNLRGNVALQTQGVQSESRTLHTDAFRMEFDKGEPGKPGKARKAETLTAGTM